MTAQLYYDVIGELTFTFEFFWSLLNLFIKLPYRVSQAGGLQLVTTS